MSAQSTPPGISQQDRTLSDLLESYRHRQSDPTIPDERQREAAERMKSVWAKLAKLQDPDGFINHLSEYIQGEYERRNLDDPPKGVEKRRKPLCRCDRSRHVCEVKQGEVPSKIRTQDLTYIPKPGSRELARQYVQEHAGDVVVREAMEGYRNLRSEIYAEVSDILAMMMGATTATEDTDASEGADGASAGGDGGGGPSPGEPPNRADDATASADGGVTPEPEPTPTNDAEDLDADHDADPTEDTEGNGVVLDMAQGMSEVTELDDE